MAQHVVAMTFSRLRLAIAQMPMRWTAAENAERIVASLEWAKAQGAQLCLFPELSLTGFHRGIREQADASIVEPAFQRVRAACRDFGIAGAIGLPTVDADGAYFNSYALIDDRGENIGSVHKNGLTPSEQTFFAAGVDRPVLTFGGRRCTTVMCREIEDVDQISLQLDDNPVDLVFWPSLVGRPPGWTEEDGTELDDPGYLAATATLARRLSAFVVQSNWPHALNTPGSTFHGESKAYAPDGDVLLTLPRDTPGLAAFTLGERAFEWLPLAA